MSTTTKKWVKVSVILYVVILLFITVATFAWFIFNDTATLQTQENMQITAGNKLEILLVNDAGEALVDQDDSTWNASWSSIIGVKTPTRIYPDITGDGQNFYFPQVLKDDEPAEMTYDKFVDISTVPENRDSYYITINVKFRTTTPMDIYLAQGSSVSAIEELHNTSETTHEYTNESMFGNFSRDAIAGAVRVAFCEKEGSSINLKNVWIPNDKYQLLYNSTFRDDVDGFTKDGERETFKYLARSSTDDSLMETVTYTADYYANRKVTVGSQLLASPTDAIINESACLLSFDANDVINGAAVKTMVIRIWIEGTDREAHMALADGQMKYDFKFVGIAKADRDTHYTDGVTTDGTNLYKNSVEVESGKWEYSYNGIDWQTYTTSFDKALEAGSKIFVRAAEVDGYKASAAITVQN